MYLRVIYTFPFSKEVVYLEAEHAQPLQCSTYIDVRFGKDFWHLNNNDNDGLLQNYAPELAC